MRKVNFIPSAILITLFMFAYYSGINAQTVESESTHSSIDIDEARKQIEQIEIQFSKDYKNADSIALAAYYAKDGSLGSVKGKDLISAWGKSVRHGIKNGTPNFTFKINSLFTEDEYLIELGEYEFRDKDHNFKSSGDYLVVWKQEDGVWKIYRDIGM